MPNTPTQCLVTGGTGYLGSRLVQRLAEAGHPVSVFCRNSSRTDNLPQGVRIVRGNLLDPAALQTALEPVEVVFHCAAQVKAWLPRKDRDQFDLVNVTATQRLCEIAQATHTRLIVTSSFFALGPSEGQTLNEHSPRLHHHYYTEYERTKTIADQHVRAAIDSGLDAVILYPGVIYGPGRATEGNLVGQTVADYLSGKLPGIPGNGRQRWTYAYIDDVVAGHCRAIQAQSGSRYILGGPVASLDQFFALLAELSGTPNNLHHLPIPLLKTAAWLMERWADCTGQPPQLTAAVAETYRHDWAYSSQQASKDLDYQPRPLKEGLQLLLQQIERD